MAKRRAQDVAGDLTAVVDLVGRSPDGKRSSEIAGTMKNIPMRTLQRWLKRLVEEDRLTQEGKGPAARY